MYGVEGSSDAISRDMDSLLYSSKFKHTADGEFAKIKELISADPYSGYSNHKLNHQNQNQNQNHEQQDCGDLNESSLMRYRSAPSSFFANLLNEDGCEDFLDPVAVVSSNHEPEERFFTRHQQQQKSGSDSRGFLQYSSSPPSMKQETKDVGIQKQDLPPPSTTAAMYGGVSRGMPNLSTSSNNNSNSNNLESSSSFTVMNSTNSNLIRQSSSPAGFLSSVTVENGFAGMRDMGKGSSSSSRLNNNISFSSRTSSSSSRFLPQIAENGNEMNDSPFNSLKRSRDGDLKMFSDLNGLDTQNGDSGHYTPSLVHHMSLPKTSSEMAAVEKFLQFQQDSVPCKIRAKRGYATHPRSIAERVRRTRISERMKKLQELFPNMDKQTNTADMLDMAVEYIKDLQKEVQILNEARARCTCSSKQLQSGSTK